MIKNEMEEGGCRLSVSFKLSGCCHCGGAVIDEKMMAGRVWYHSG